jgi:hypothetical protein
MKGSMSGDARGFNTIETQAVIKVVPARKDAKGNLRQSDNNIGETCTIVCHR